MLRPRNRTKAISSSSFSKRLLAAAALGAALCGPVLAGSRPDQVKIPVETLWKRRTSPPPLDGLLWNAGRQVAETSGRAVLLIPGAGGSKEEWRELAEDLQAAGFYVLAIDTRGKGTQGKQTYMEDIQSGVIFLKSETSKPKVGAYRVAVVASDAGANAAANYAAANAQMHLIVDSMAMLSPAEKIKGVDLFDGLKRMTGIPVLMIASDGDKVSGEDVKKAKELCRTKCEATYFGGTAAGTAILGSSHGADVRKAIVDFLLRPHG
jgi:hypothetical protein